MNARAGAVAALILTLAASVMAAPGAQAQTEAVCVLFPGASNPCDDIGSTTDVVEGDNLRLLVSYPVLVPVGLPFVIEVLAVNMGGTQDVDIEAVEVLSGSCVVDAYGMVPDSATLGPDDVDTISTTTDQYHERFLMNGTEPCWFRVSATRGGLVAPSERLVSAFLVYPVEDPETLPTLASIADEWFVPLLFLVALGASLWNGWRLPAVASTLGVLMPWLNAPPIAPVGALFFFVLSLWLQFYAERRAPREGGRL